MEEPQILEQAVENLRPVDLPDCEWIARSSTRAGEHGSKIKEESGWKKTKFPDQIGNKSARQVEKQTPRSWKGEVENEVEI